jgi:hypothetical protein
VKSTFMTMLGETEGRSGASGKAQPEPDLMPNPVNVLKGLFGR